MKNDFIISLDQGSSSSKAAIFNATTGRCLALSSKELILKAEDLICEYDPEDILKTQFAAFDEVLANVDSKKVSEISLCAQRSTIVLWDKTTGKPLCPAISWLDGRAQKEIAQNEISQEVFHQKTGLYKTPYFSAPKIKWCIDNYPAVASALKNATLCVGPVTSFLVWTMTKGQVFACDYATAQRTLLFNINTFKWDEDILKSFNIPLNILPNVLPSASDYGTYKGIKISVSTGDQQAACAACGVLEKGSALINYGTGAFFLLNIGHKSADVKGILTSLAWSRPNRDPYYLLEAPLNTAGSFLAWLKNLGIHFDMKKLDAINLSSKNPVWFLPALGGIGAPYFDFSLKPVLAGLTPSTQKEDIIAGALRGLVLLMGNIIFYIKDNGFEIDSLQCSGGLSVNKSMMSFQAGILGREILQNNQKESTLTGGALIAALNDGRDVTAWRELKKCTKITPILTPQDRTEILHNWQKFFDWAIKQPR